LEEKKKLVFIITIVVFIVVLVIALVKNNNDYLAKSNQKGNITTSSKNYQIIEPTITKDVKVLDNKQYEELIKNFIAALSFVDKDPKILEEFVDKDSSYYMELIAKKEYIGKSVDGIFIESVNVKGSIHNVKVKMTISGTHNCTFQIKSINGRYMFVGSER